MTWIVDEVRHCDFALILLTPASTQKPWIVWEAGAVHGAAATLTEAPRKVRPLLFQVTDDLLDVTQSSETLGKTAGKDAAAEKATYPSLLGLDETRRLAAELEASAIAALDGMSGDTSLLHGLVNILATRTN